MTVPTVTLQDLADSLGVARSTVSRALRDDPQISSDMRERARALALQRGYRPNAAARALTRRRAGAVGLVLPRTSSFVFANPYFSELLEGIASVAEPAGLPLLVSASPEPDYAAWLVEGRVDGIITLGSSLRPEEARLLEAHAGRGAPVVLVHETSVPCGLAVVASDERPGLAAATAHLSGAGLTRAALVTGPQSSRYARARADGWQRAAAGHGIDVVRVLHGDDTLRSGAEAAEALLHANPNLDVWLFGNDLMALGGLAVLDELGRDPQRPAVVGFDDVMPAALVGLSTVRQGVRDLGAEAMRLLARALDGAAPASVTLPTTFVARRSSDGVTGSRSTRAPSARAGGRGG